MQSYFGDRTKRESMALPPLIVASLLIELIFAFKCAFDKRDDHADTGPPPS